MARPKPQQQLTVQPDGTVWDQSPAAVGTVRPVFSQTFEMFMLAFPTFDSRALRPRLPAPVRPAAKMVVVVVVVVCVGATCLLREQPGGDSRTCFLHLTGICLALILPLPWGLNALIRACPRVPSCPCTR